jgi:pyruvate formate lyase activating enzyme
LKGFSDNFYRKICGVNNFELILKNIEYLYNKIHLEITTPVIPKLNDKDIPEIAQYIASLNENIPLHLLRFYPAYKMQQYKSPTVDDMKQLYMQAKKHLNYLTMFMLVIFSVQNG